MKTGNPNGDGLPFWPAANENYGYLEIGEEIAGREGLEDKLDLLTLEFVRLEYE